MKKLLSLLLLTAGVASAVRPGDTAPNFTLKNDAGKIITLSELRGQPVVLNFWATWCLVCKEELPELNREAAALNVKNVFAVSATDAPKEAIAYFQKSNLKRITPLVDAPNHKGLNSSASVARAYRIIGQPVAVFINRDGKVTAVHQGYLPAEQFRAYLEQTQAK